MGALTKADLAEMLFDELGLNKREAKEIVEMFYAEISSALENNDQVKISGFGNFDLRDKKSRPGRNPKTGEEITALKTASSGYLTRRLCDVAQDLTITKVKCDDPGFIELSEILEGGNVVVSLSERALGRVTAAEVKNPLSGEIIIKKSEMIDEAGCDKIDAAGVTPEIINPGVQYPH